MVVIPLRNAHAADDLELDLLPLDVNLSAALGEQLLLGQLRFQGVAVRLKDLEQSVDELLAGLDGLVDRVLGTG